MMLTLSGYANEYGRRQGRDGGTEGEIALIFAAEIELLLGSFAAAPPPERETIGLFNLHRNSFLLCCLSYDIPCLYQKGRKIS